MASFTTLGDTVSLSMQDKGEDVLVSISGTYDMTIELQREEGSRGSGSWQTLQSWSTANATVAYHHETSQYNEELRLIATVVTSGTATATIADNSDKVVHTITDLVGNTLATRTQAGVTEHGTLTVEGAATLASATVTGTLAISGELTGLTDVNTTITAYASGGQANATALTGRYNNVTTCATDGDSVKLPAAAQGGQVTVKNSGATSLAVFPAASDSINALAANLSVNVPVGGELTFTAISAVVWETNEVVVLPAPSTQKGELVLKAADNASDVAVTVVNASHGQATTHTIGDPGVAAAYIVESTAQITLAEADVLDGATAGTAVGAKALVVDASLGISGLGVVGLRSITLATASTLTALATGATIATAVASVQEIIAFLQAKMGAS